MKKKNVQLLMDCCLEAARVPLLTPKLPEGVTPGHLRVMEQVAKMEDEVKPTRISDISVVMGMARSGITRTVNELEQRGYMTKTKDPLDNRVVYAHLTPAGREMYSTYVVDYYRRLSKSIDTLTDRDAKEFARILRLFLEAVKKDTASQPPARQ